MAIEVADAAVLARLAPATPSPYHRLNPLTKAVLAAVATLASLALGGYIAPVLLFAMLVAPGAVVAGVFRRVMVSAILVTLPLAIAVGLVSVFTRPGATVLFALGPFDATLEGADFAARVVLRLVVMASALALFGLTTPVRALIADLERRGVSPRPAFALGAVVGAVPALAARARDVRDAQRARGLDTEGTVLRRLAAVVPLAGPIVLGAIHQVEARSLALEARAFGRPGRRHLLWAPPDTGSQRLARWLLLAGLAAVLAGSMTGFLPRLP
ncbi:MAG: energy-coupling factor transporter transmembrane component T [Candidatus Limnocylindrales bacterium]